MNTGISLAQQLQIKITMTTELQQSIHILQLSHYDLEQYLQEQAAENPLIELEAYGDAYIRAKNRTKRDASDADPLWNAKAQGESLEQYLLGQWRLAGYEPGLYKAAAYIAGNIDEQGYLTLSVPEISQGLKQPQETVEAALARLQTLEPAGVGARNLRECLLIQIRRDPDAPRGADEVIGLCMEQLAAGRLDKISLQLGLPVTELQEIASYIRTLNPRPGLAHSTAEEPYAAPDAAVFKEGEDLVIRMNAESCPRIAINDNYFAMIQSGAHKEAVSYLKDHLKSANWLARSLEQRKITMYRVIRAIFEEQFSFLDRGVEGLKPLKLKTIAEKLGLHESTISRAVQNKYVKTPFGFFELKYFFSTGLQTDVGIYASNKIIKAKLLELISREDKHQPFSDQKIAEELSRDGIRISRRTVTKYREELNVLSSGLRKTL